MVAPTCPPTLEFHISCVYGCMGVWVHVCMGVCVYGCLGES